MPGPTVRIRLHGVLGDFVDSARRGVEFACDLGEPRSVKDLLESVGPPHCEALVVLVNGESVAFDRRIVGGERIAAFPHISEIDLGGLPTAGVARPRDARFVLDGHLGRLAAYLRALGVDAAHDRDADDAAIARIAADEDRVVLTRDIGLLKRSNVRHGSWIRATAPREQLAEVVRRFRIENFAPFTRCLRCNATLVELSRDEASGRVPARILASFNDFKACPSCGRTFWRGTHHARLMGVLSGHLKSAPRGLQA